MRLNRASLVRVGKQKEEGANQKHTGAVVRRDPLNKDRFRVSGWGCGSAARAGAGVALLRLLELLQLELELALLGLVDSVARIYGVIDFSHVRLGTCCGVQVKSGK